MASTCAAAAAAKLPGEQAGEADGYAAGREAEDANAGGREAEERLGQPRLQGDQRRLIDIAPGQMMAADQEIQLVAKEAVAEMAAPERAGQMDQKGEAAKMPASSRAVRRDVRAGIGELASGKSVLS
jgi:hypothetical protein